MRIPRDLAGSELAKALRKLGYETTRQTGSHMRLTTVAAGEHHVSVPMHKVLPVGTLRSILKEIGLHFSADDVAASLFS
ncbi:MAG: type II toxin-antitoxin system HicA family toxin [Bryobacteraceae bacterium]